MENIIPVILFAYNRPNHLRRTLKCLRENNIPTIYIFSDGPKNPDKESAVQEVRKILHEINWCNTIITERDINLGLGQSILNGVTEILQNEAAAIVFEDDLICVPGTYNYLCAAMKHYRDDTRVMSVTGWTHPLVTPKNVIDQPYFDGRAECLVWGTWARAWEGMMDQGASSLMKRCKERGIDIYRYGADLPHMAKGELKRNIWAVRFLYWHIFNQGLCLRPPWSMVEHIGFDKEASNAQSDSWIKNPPLKSCPPLPDLWPEPVEHPECYALHQSVCGTRPALYSRLIKPFRRFSSICLNTASRWGRGK